MHRLSSCAACAGTGVVGLAQDSGIVAGSGLGLARLSWDVSSSKVLRASRASYGHATERR